MALANILPPGYRAFKAVQEQNEQGELAELQKVQGALGIMSAMDKQKQDLALRELLATTGGDAEKAVEMAVKSGNIAAAHQLAPILKLQQEQRQKVETRKGLSALMALDTPAQANPMVPGPGASVMAGGGTVTPQPAAPVSPDLAREARRKSLNGMALLYADNPTMQAMVQREIAKLDEAAKPPPMSQLGKLIAERDKYRPGSKEYQIYDQAITKFQPGGVQVNINPNAPLIPGKPAQNKVDEGLLDTGMRLQKLTAIEQQFKPEFMQYGTKIGAAWSSLKDKANMPLDPGEQELLTKFSQFRRNAIDSLNEYIKSITGAAMTDTEAQRILRGLPNPGTGIFDGDSPTEFKAKMDDAIKQLRVAEARFVYIKRNGLTVGDVPLDRMPRLMNERGAELEKAVRAQNAQLSDVDVRKLVKRNLAQEFGLAE